MSERRKVAIFCSSLHGGGAERVMVNMANALAKTGIPVDLIVKWGEGAYREEVSKKVNLVDLKTPSSVKCLPKLIKYLIKNKPKVFYSTQNQMNNIAVLAKWFALSKTKVVLREANIIKGYVFPTKGEKIVMKFSRFIYPFANAYVGVSEGVSKDLRESFKLKNVHTIYSPLYNEHIEISKQEKVQHPFFDLGLKVLVSCGRTDPQKDFATLIKAFSIVKKQIDCRLIIIGKYDGAESEIVHLKKVAGDLGVEDFIDFKGFEKNPFAFMAKSHVYVLSSKFEGLPGTLVQALACGCSIVSTDCHSGPAEILENGKHGYLVPVGDYEELANKIVLQLKEPLCTKESLINRAKFFSEENAVNKFVDLFYNS